MTGVEILATQEVVTAYAWNWTAYFITMFICALLFGFISCMVGYCRFEDFLFGCVVGCVVGLLSGILPAKVTKPKEYETRYKVLISDEVHMNDFLERYEIIDQEGKIYTVREIEDGK